MRRKPAGWIFLAAALSASAALVIAAPVASGSVVPATVAPKCPPDCPPPPGGGGGGESDPDKNKNNNGEHHGGTGGDSSTGTTDTPAAPPNTPQPAPAKPPDAVGPGMGPKSNVDDNPALAQFREQLKYDRIMMAVFCGLAVAIQQRGLDAHEVPIKGFDDNDEDIPAAMVGDLCDGSLAAVLDDLSKLAAVQTAFDNSAISIRHGGAVEASTDPEYLQVALPATPAAATVTSRCAKRLTPRACFRLNAALTLYVQAFAARQAAMAGLATSLERFAAAGNAASPDGQRLQAGAAKIYAAQLAAAAAQQQLAGRALANSLRAARIDARVADAKSRQMLIRRLAAPTSIPAAIVAQLVAAGAIGSAAELAQKLGPVLADLPPTFTLLGRIALTPSPDALTPLPRTLNVYELAAIVRALVAQSAITAATGAALLDDLRQVLAATASAAHTAALAALATHVARVAEPAGALLTTAARSLS